VRWFRQAANQSLPDAEYMLGLVYQQGDGYEQDYAEARKWFLLAARRGYAAAQFMYAFMLQAGEGADSDSYNAYLWSKIAELNGMADAVDIYSIAGLLLNNRQIEQIETLALSCFESSYTECPS